MSMLDWKKLFASCRIHNRRVLLVPGFPALTRSELGLQPFATNSLSSSDIDLMLREMPLAAEQQHGFPGGIFFNVAYEGTTIQIGIVGEAHAKSVLLTPSSGQIPFGYEVFATNSSPPLDQILTACIVRECDLILVPDCSPILWSRLGISLFNQALLTGDEISRLSTEKMPSADLVRQEQGFLNYGIVFEGQKFNTFVFGIPTPYLTASLNISPT